MSVNDKKTAVDIYDYDEAIGDVLSILRTLYNKGYIEAIRDTAMEKELLEILANDPANDSSIKDNDEESLIIYKEFFVRALNILYEINDKKCIDMSLLDERTNKNLLFIINPQVFEKLT